MGLFSSCSNKNHTELICDIGNSSIGIALVEYNQNGKTPNIIFSDRVKSPSKQKRNFSDTVIILKRDLEILLTRTFRYCVSKNIKPSHASCFYSSPWYIAQTHILKISQTEQVLFSESILRKILDEAERNFLSDETIKINSTFDNNLVLIERKITRIKLNGYQTHNPIGKKAGMVEASLFLSAISQETNSLVCELINKVWHKIPIQHHTFPLASFAMIKNEFHTFSNFLIIHVADNVTDISLINDEMLLDTFSFPLGSRNIIENIEKDCSLDYELASSMLSMYEKNELHTDHIQVFNKTIDYTKKDLRDHFENAFSVLTKKAILPNVVYLISAKNTLSLLSNVIKEYGLNTHIQEQRELNVYPVSFDLFNKYVTYSTPAHKDFFVEIEASYINLMSSSLEKIIDNYTLE